MAELPVSLDLSEGWNATYTVFQPTMSSIYTTAGVVPVSIGQRRPITKSQFAGDVLAPQLTPTNYATASSAPQQLAAPEGELPFETYFSTTSQNLFQKNRYPSQPAPFNHQQVPPVGANSWGPVMTTVDKQQHMFGSRARHASVPTSAQVSPTGSLSQTPITGDEDTDSDEEEHLSHPNKYPVEIEYHTNKQCCYRRQPTRSGPKLKHRYDRVYNPSAAMGEQEMQVIKYYQKDLVRMCRCGNYTQMDGALVHGRANDCDGYEIHYSQKCKWKAYDDYKTGKRVLIRLCKCYKPF